MRSPSPLLRGTSWSRKSPGGRDNVPLIFCRSDAKSCLTVCDPINYSTPGFPVLHYLPELLKLMSIELRCHPTILSTVIPFSSHLQSFPASESFPISQLLTSGSQKYWSFSFSISPSSENLGVISFGIDWFDPLAVRGTLKSSPLPQFESINSSVLKPSLWPTLTSVHDYWKNHNFNCRDQWKVQWVTWCWAIKYKTVELNVCQIGMRGSKILIPPPRVHSQ